MNAYTREQNPFAVTKANDFDDNEILRYWVDTPGHGRDIGDFVRPRSLVPIYLLGAKGSGKTHLLRYYSYPLQKLRFQDAGLAPLAGVQEDGYLGIYLLCGGLNTGRFSGKGQDPARWKELFAYYVELWLAGNLIETVRDVLAGVSLDEATLCSEVMSLFDETPQHAVDSLAALDELITRLRKDLDLQINNCVFTGRLDVQITATRGRLSFGIPKLLSRVAEAFSSVSFVYVVDELENLSESQQMLINSLVRDRMLPTTFRVGVRRYGIKTHQTDASQEKNLPDSEFEQVVLDDEFRRNKDKYLAFARRLISKRLVPAAVAQPKTANNLVWCFETQDERWNSSLYLEIVRSAPSHERRHFRILTEQLLHVGASNPDRIVELLSVPEYPLLEKVNLLFFYRALKDLASAVSEADRIATECGEFLANNGHVEPRNRVKRTLGHYQSDLLAQLRRENRAKQLYLGLDNFLSMSGGVPRALLTTLRNIFDWALYNGEDPSTSRGISIDAQYRGVSRASDWFFDYNIRKAGSDGMVIQNAADRLAQLFRTNRFSHRPVECSLNSFSVAEHELQPETLRVLRLCESRSLLNRIVGGQKHRNTKRVEMKFQLHPMLCPRWQLPLARRGIIPLKAGAVDVIFDMRRGEEFESFLRTFRVSRTFGYVRSSAQRTLFDA